MARTAAAFLADKGLSKVLDVGCGYGRDCLYLARQGLDLVGVDISPAALGLGARWKERQGINNIQFVCSDLGEIEFSPASFGAVIIYNVMHLLNELQRGELGAKIRRILKPGGLLVQAVFSTKEEGYGCGAPMEKNSYPTPGGRLRHFFAREEIEELFTGFNFLHLEEVVIPEQQVGKPPHVHQEWLMVLEKCH